MLRRAAAALAATAAVGGAGLAWWAAPPAANKGRGHPPPDASHSAYLRRVGSGEHVAPADNPGVRVYPGVLSPREAAALLRELAPLETAHGADLIAPRHAAVYRWQMSFLGAAAPPVNMLRVTARPEIEGQRPPPWGYGDGCDEGKLPPALRALAERLRSLPGMRLGRLRDVTINVRRACFFRLDPHVDPAADGETVAIVSVDAGTVLTLCPRRWLRLRRAWDEVEGAATLRDDRELESARASASWTTRDVDVRADARACVVLSGDARWEWTHGTRLGVLAPGKGKQLHDWWGRRDDLLPRGGERHSVVFAFAAADECDEAGGGDRDGSGGTAAAATSDRRE